MRKGRQVRETRNRGGTEEEPSERHSQWRFCGREKGKGLALTSLVFLDQIVGQRRDTNVLARALALGPLLGRAFCQKTKLLEF